MFFSAVECRNGGIKQGMMDLAIFWIVHGNIRAILVIQSKYPWDIWPISIYDIGCASPPFDIFYVFSCGKLMNMVINHWILGRRFKQSHEGKQTHMHHRGGFKWQGVGWFEASVAIFLYFLGHNRRRKVRSNSATEAATNPGASSTNPRFHKILLDLGTERKIQVIGSIVQVYYMHIILHTSYTVDICI